MSELVVRRCALSHTSALFCDVITHNGRRVIMYLLTVLWRSLSLYVCQVITSILTQYRSSIKHIRVSLHGTVVLTARDSPSHKHALTIDLTVWLTINLTDLSTVGCKFSDRTKRIHSFKPWSIIQNSRALLTSLHAIQCSVSISDSERWGSHGWWSGVVVSALTSINEVNQRRARLVLRRVTVFGFNSWCRTFISVCNQPATQGQLSLPSLRGR